jgi:hypothetical protein
MPVTGQQALSYFGTPFLGVITGLERPFTADRVAAEGTEGSEHGLNLLHAGGFTKLRSKRAEIFNVMAVLVCRTDLIQPLLDYDLLMALEAPPAPTQIQERPDQILLRAARGAKFLVQPSAKRLVVFVPFAPEHDLCCVCAVLQRVALFVPHGHCPHPGSDWRWKRAIALAHS